MFNFGVKDIIDIFLFALLLYYVYRLMKESGTINIFYGVLSFIVVWVQLGSKRRWKFLSKLFRHHNDGGDDSALSWVMPIVYACMSMSKSHTGALIVIEQSVPLDNYAKSGDIIDAIINTRLIENIFFKNSPLHDGAMVIEHGRISAAGCILPVSHDSDVPRSLGLRHRSALGIAQATDAVAVVVSEETGNISVAHRGKLYTRVSTTELENRLNAIAITMNR